MSKFKDFYSEESNLVEDVISNKLHEIRTAISEGLTDEKLVEKFEISSKTLEKAKEQISKIEEEEEEIGKFFEEFEKDFENDVPEEDMIEKYKSLSMDLLDKLEELCNEEEDEYDAFYTEDLDLEENPMIAERLVKKIVVRKGKKIKKFKSDKPNFRVVLDPDTKRPKEVRMNSAEVRKRKRGQRLGAIKRKASSAISKIKRKISNKKRGLFGLGKK